METATEKSRKEIIDKYAPNLDHKTFPSSKKLENAKAYFQEHGVPDFNKILKEAEEKKTR